MVDGEGKAVPIKITKVLPGTGILVSQNLGVVDGGGGGEGCHPDGEPAQVPGLRPRHQDHPDRRVTRQGSQEDQAQQGLSLKAHPPVPVLVPCWSMCKDL